MKIENPPRTKDDLVICKHCMVQFDFSHDVVFTQHSRDCNGQEFSIPEYENMTIRNWNTTTKLLALL